MPQRTLLLTVSVPRPADDPDHDTIDDVEYVEILSRLIRDTLTAQGIPGVRISRAIAGEENADQLYTIRMKGASGRDIGGFQQTANDWPTLFAALATHIEVVIRPTVAAGIVITREE